MPKKKKPSKRLASFVRRLLKKRVLRYLIVGGSVYALEVGIILMAGRYRATPTQAVAISYTVGLVVSFFLQKLVTFGDKRMHHHVVLKQALAVTLLVIFNFGFTLLVTRLLQSYVSPVITRTIALLITVIWNFYLYRTRIFNPPKNKKEKVVVTVERPHVLIQDIRPHPLTKHQPVKESPFVETPQTKMSALLSLTIIGLCLSLLTAMLLAATLVMPVESRVDTKTSSAPRAVAPDMVCKGKFILQVVAHQDDDLLFINPDIQTSLDAGDCVRTVYLTAGNATLGKEYMQRREEGAKAAYATMLHQVKPEWKSRGLQLQNHARVELNTLGNQVSLLFLRLPDGGQSGVGFGNHGEPPRSLAGLLDGKTKQLDSLDGRSTYDEQTLINTLLKIMERYKPSEVRTQAVLPKNLGRDHSDHYATGWFTRRALATYEAAYPNRKPTLMLYQGYANIYEPADVMDGQLKAKTDTFLAYIPFDGSVCHDSKECNDPSNLYAQYLARHYTIPVSDAYEWPSHQ